MKNLNKYCILFIAALVVSILTISYAYFSTTIKKENTSNNELNSGSFKLDYEEVDVNIDYFTPIYDETYETASYQKSFSFSNNSNYNSCTTIYLDISKISEELKTSSLKYRLIREDGEIIDGNFENISDNKLIINKLLLENGQSKNYTLYIWLSYSNNINQTNMLGKKIKSKIVVSGIATNNNICN